MNVNDIRSNEQLSEYIEENGNPLFVFFYGGIYSQWYASPFIVDGKKFLTAEHWMMYKKAQTFNDVDIEKKIFIVEHPAEVKKLGRLVKNFDPDKWAEVAFEYVVQGNVHKFSQNPETRKVLEKNDGRVLVEASPTDRIWGIGLSEWDAKNAVPVKDWKGTNLLGYAIMEARERLKETHVFDSDVKEQITTCKTCFRSWVSYDYIVESCPFCQTRTLEKQLEKKI